MTICVDLFSGLGGFSTGAKQAGCTIKWAGNHWPLAVDFHSRHHPQAVHICQDLQQYNFNDLPPHDLLLASPACQGHSPARGREKPHHDAQRSTAWAVVSAVEAKSPPVVIVENVPAFQTWALFPAWKLAMESLGYSISPHILDAADFGVPQHRVRLFLVCTRSQVPLVLNLKKTAWEPFGPSIQWSSYPWSPIDRPGRSAATKARIEAGRLRYGDRFLAPYYGSGSGLSGRSLDRPIGTIRTHDCWSVVDQNMMRMLQPDELRLAMGFPECELPSNRSQAIHLLGNAVCPPVAEGLIRAVQAQG